MERTKFNGLLYNGNRYPNGWMVPGGFLAYPSEKCEMKHCIFKYEGIPIIDFGCCISVCKKKCYRYTQWRGKNYAEYQAIHKKFREFKEGV